MLNRLFLSLFGYFLEWFHTFFKQRPKEKGGKKNSLCVCVGKISKLCISLFHLRGSVGHNIYHVFYCIKH